MAAVRKRRFTTSTLEHDACPTPSDPCSDFARILGGVWGIVLWALINASTGNAYWIRALVIGALGPSLIAWFVVMPIKGMGPAGGWDPKVIVGGLLLNGAWGAGVALLMRLLNRVSLQ